MCKLGLAAHVMGQGRVEHVQLPSVELGASGRLSNRSGLRGEQCIKQAVSLDEVVETASSIAAGQKANNNKACQCNNLE